MHAFMTSSYIITACMKMAFPFQYPLMLRNDEFPYPIFNERNEVRPEDENNENTNNNHQGPEMRGSSNLNRVIVEGDNGQNGDNENPNDDYPIQSDQFRKKKFTFSPYYMVQRFSRTLKRSEVLGFGCVSLVLICIALEAQTGLQSLNFHQQSNFSTSRGKDILELEEGNHPDTEEHFHTFSWIILSEFFLPESLSAVDRECRMYSGRSSLAKPFNVTSQTESPEFKIIPIRKAWHRRLLKCDPETTQYSNGWLWLREYLMGMFLPIVNLISSLVLLSSIACRRKKGLQFTLMIPGFCCVLKDLFHQIPLIFRYTYAGAMLMQDMQASMSDYNPPEIISQVWDDTQRAGQCCGIQNPDSWMQVFATFQSQYPKSCCNFNLVNCSLVDLPNRNQVWEKGCYKQEYAKLKQYQFYGVLIMMLKLVAEIGILWSVSDLTRYHYPMPQEQMNSLSNVKEFEVRTKGCAYIKGVTDCLKMVVKLKNFSPGKYKFRTAHVTTGRNIIISTVKGSKGYVEIRQIRGNNNTRRPSVDLNYASREGMIFINFS